MLLEKVTTNKAGITLDYTQNRQQNKDPTSKLEREHQNLDFQHSYAHNSTNDGGIVIGWEPH